MTDLYRADPKQGAGFGFPTVAALDWDYVARLARTQERTITMNMSLQSAVVGRAGYRTAVVVKIPQGTDAAEAKKIALAAVRDYVNRARLDYQSRKAE